MRVFAFLLITACSSPAPGARAPVAVKEEPPDAGMAEPVEECVQGLALTALDGEAMVMCGERGCWAFAADGSWSSADASDTFATATVDDGRHFVEVCTAADACSKVVPQSNGMVTGAAVDRGGKLLAIVVDVSRKGRLELWDLAASRSIAMISGEEVEGARFLEDRLLVTSDDVDEEWLDGELVEWTGKKVSRLARYERVGASAAIGGRRAVIQLGDKLTSIDLASGDADLPIEWTLLGEGELARLEVAGANGRVAVVAHFLDGTARAGVFTLGVVDPTLFAVPFCAR